MNQVIAFGTDGIRGHAERWPFTDDSLYILGNSLAQWVGHKYGEGQSIMIGYDTRESADRIKKSLAQGFMHDNKVTIYDAGVIPTPALLWWARKKGGVRAAVMISASHNPFHDNGIKVFDVQSGKISADDEVHISALYNRFYECIDSWNFCRDREIALVPSFEWHEAYKLWLQEAMIPRLWAEKKIIIDAAHGALSTIAYEVFKLFASDVQLVHADPDGKNINDGCGALYPDRLAKLVVAQKAFLGFAFDGDGDRVIAVDEHGIVRDGDDMLYLLLEHPAFSCRKVVVGTIMSNSGFEQAVVSKGKILIRTPVGDKYVAAAMQEHNAVLGGEASGHIILKPFVDTGDGLFVAIKIFEAIVAYHASFDNSFARFTQVHRTLPVPARIPFEELACYKELQKFHDQINPGRMIIRYSGTEALVRVTTEHVDADLAEQINTTVVSLLKNAY